MEQPQQQLLSISIAILVTTILFTIYYLLFTIYYLLFTLKNETWVFTRSNKATRFSASEFEKNSS